MIRWLESGAARLRRGCVPLAAVALSCACAPSRPPLPPGPPPRPLTELEAWREPPPLSGASLAAEGRLRTERVALDNGASVTVVERPETNVIAVALWVPGAADWSHGPVASMVYNLRAGTRSGGSVLINPGVDGRSITSTTGPTGTLFTWTVLPNAADKALELLADYVIHPAFEPPEVMRRHEQELIDIANRSGTYADFSRIAASPFTGQLPTPEENGLGLKRLTAEVLRKVHACALRPNGAELIIVGPVNTAATLARARAELADWTPVATNDAECASVEATGRDERIAQPLDRTELRLLRYYRTDPWLTVVLPAPATTSEDHAAFTVLSQAVVQRMMLGEEDLRHAGAAYYINASIADLPGYGLLALEGQFAADRVQDSIRKVVNAIWSAADALTDVEFELMKRRLQTELIASFGHNAGVARAVLAGLRRGRDITSLESWFEELAAVKPERCRELARSWLSDSKPSMLVATRSGKFVSGLGFDADIKVLALTRQPQAKRKVGHRSR